MIQPLTTPTNADERIAYITKFGYKLQRLDEDIARLEAMEMSKIIDFTGRSTLEHISRVAHEYALTEFINTVHILCIAVMREKAKELRDQLTNQVKP